MEVVEEYVDSKTKITHRCKKHGVEWKSSPGNILRGKGCDLCKRERIGQKKTKMDINAYKLELSTKNPTVRLICGFKNISTESWHYCMKHNRYFLAKGSQMLKGVGCELCHYEKIHLAKMKTNIQYILDLNLANPTVIAVDEYINAYTPIKHLCLVHNKIWITSPASALQGSGCPLCDAIRKSHSKMLSEEEYIDRLLVVNPNLKLIGKYQGMHNLTEHKCLKCGKIWSALPTNLLAGHGCQCSAQSRGEREVKRILEEFSIEYEEQKTFDGCKNILPLRFDFFLPEYNCCIEYDGLQHFQPVCFGGCSEEKAICDYERTKSNDRIKNKFCSDNNIRLLRIPYHTDIRQNLLEYFEILQ